MSEIPEFLDLQQVIAYLKNLRSRGEIKRWGKWLEKSVWYDDVLTVIHERIGNYTIINPERSDEVSECKKSSFQKKWWDMM